MRLRATHRIPRVLVMAITLILVANVAATPALATRYTPPWADAFTAKWDGAGGLDTRQSGINMTYITIPNGYASWNDTYFTAKQSMGTSYAQSDAIWAMFGHANVGFITMYSPTYGSTVLRATGTSSGNDATLSNYTTAQLHYIRLMVFGGCHTAGYTGGVSLQTVAYNRGVDSSVAWTGEIAWPHMDTWTYYFFAAAASPSKYTVFNAAIYAEQKTLEIHKGYGGVDSSVVWGGSKYLYPAGYGS
jgi:hypothetical protein